MKQIDYTEVTIKLMDEYTSKYLQENAELVQDTIKATLEAINYSRCCKSDSEQLKCDCCDGTGLVEGEHYDDVQGCLTCNGRGTF